MFKWFKKRFIKRKPFQCGGLAHVRITDSLDRTIAKIYYRRPTSEEILNLSWELAKIESDKEVVSEIDGAKNKMLAIHSELIKKIYVPFAEKVFEGVAGEIESNGEKIETLSKAQQFESLKNYYSHVIVDFCSVAYQKEGIVKKN